jgi:hypothetical protein
MKGYASASAGGKPFALDGAKGTDIPPPHEETSAADKPTVRAEDLPEEFKTLGSMYKVLPPDAQTMHLWAQRLPGVYDAQNGETQWSDEYFAKWLATPQAGVLGKIPVMVLSQADGGYRDGEAGIPAAQLEKQRKEGQAKLLKLSSNSKQVIVHSGHNMNLEAPEDASNAIREVVNAVRNNSPLKTS